MLDFLRALLSLFSKDSLYWFCALAGSGLFLIQFLLSILGANHDNLDHGHHHEGGSDLQFKWLSKQALTGFLMMFGWTGLTCKSEFGLQGPLSGAIAAMAGLAAFFVTGLIFKLARKLKSTGTIFRIEETIGKDAVVYQRIPKQGSGKISLVLHDHTYEIEAVSKIEEEIASFTQVQIISIEDGNIVGVVPYK